MDFISQCRSQRKNDGEIKMESKKIFQGLATMLIIDIATYISFYVKDEGLSNIGYFILWAFSILLLITVFINNKDDEPKGRPHFILRTIFMFMFYPALLAIIYNAE